MSDNNFVMRKVIISAGVVDEVAFITQSSSDIM